MLFSIVKNPILYTIYEYDTTLFVKILCVNKNRQQIKCEGKCYLAIMKQEQDEKDATNKLKQLQSEVVYCNLFNPVYFTLNGKYKAEKSEFHSFYNSLYAYLFASGTNEPPEHLTLA